VTKEKQSGLTLVMCCFHFAFCNPSCFSFRYLEGGGCGQAWLSAPSERCRGSHVVESDETAKERAALFKQRGLSDDFEMHTFTSPRRASTDNAAPLPIPSLGAAVNRAGLVGGGGDGNPRAGVYSPVCCRTCCSMGWQAVFQLANSSAVFSVNEKVFLIAT